jgi:hypothetical protein
VRCTRLSPYVEAVTSQVQCECSELQQRCVLPVPSVSKRRSFPVLISGHKSKYARFLDRIGRKFSDFIRDVVGTLPYPDE